MAADAREPSCPPDHPVDPKPSVPSATEEAAALRRRAEDAIRSLEAAAGEEAMPDDARHVLYELRRSHEKLDAARARYFELYDLAPVGYVTLDEDGLILDANLTAMQLFGASTGELDSQPLSRFVLREDQDVFYHHCRRLFTTREPQTSELQLVRNDGTPFWAQLHSIVARPEDGDAPFCRTVITEIGERKLAELEASVLLERFNLAVGAAGLGVWDWDIGNDGLVWDDRMYELYGIRREDGRAAYDEWLAAIHPDDTAAAIAAAQTALQDDDHYDTEFRIVRPDGAVRHLKAFGRVQRDRGGRPLRVTGVNLDVTDRRRAETALRQSEARYRDLIENLNDVIFVVRLDGTLEYVSPAVTTILGYQPEDLVGTTFTDIVHSDDVEAIREAFQSVLEGDLEPREYRLVDREGEPHWVRTSSRPLIKEGVTVGLQGVLTDITAARRAQAALATSELNILETIENVHLIALELGTDGQIQFINDFALGITGWSRDEVLGRNWFDEFLPAGQREEVRGIFLQTVASGEFPPHYDNPIVTRGGEERFVHWSNTTQRGANGRITGVFSLGEDLTEVVEAEMALRESEEKYRGLFTSMVEGFALHEIINDDAGDPVDYRFLDGNSAFYDLTGLGPDIIGRTVLEVMPEIERYWIETYARVARTGRSEHFEHRAGADGKHVDVRAFSPEPGKFATVFLDITERKRAEAERDRLLSEVRGLATRLAEAEEAQRKDLARELHDRVGQNLTALGLNLSVLRNRLSEEELTKVGSHLDDAANLLVETTHEVRQVMTELRPPMLDEYGLMPALEWLAGVYSERAGVKVTASGSEPTPRLGSRAEMAIFRIVQEALTNVGKHAAAAAVEISVEHSPGSVRVTIADDGRGFSVETVQPEEGRDEGWGMAIMKERAMSIGGMLQVKSEAGCGTEIVVELLGGRR